MKSIEKWRWLAFAVAAALLAGGCDSTRDAPLDELAAERRANEALVYDPVTVRGKVAAKSSLPPVIPADAHLHGVWSSVIDWPLIAVHVVLLPDGRVLSYGSDGSGAPTGYFNYDLWTPSMGYAADAHLLLPNVTLTDLFCGSQVVLPQPGAGVFLAGGDAA